MAKHNNTGGLWRNKYKQLGDTKPDFVGEITLGGVTHKIAGWHNQTSGPRPLISIKVQEEYKTPVPHPPASLPDGWESDIPF